MIINVKNTTMVRPTEETPKRSMPLSNLDLLFLINPSVTFIYCYRSNGSSDFFSSNPIKEALGKALVLFYPFAGRLRKDPDGRVEIDCNGNGVLFVEAETTSLLDDLHEFSSISGLKNLIPTIDYSDDISSYPLFVIQLTYFNCGGASIGIAMNHIVGDGVSCTHFINTWAEIARGVDPSNPPIHDRTLLQGSGCSEPPQPKFEHIEDQPLVVLKPNFPEDLTRRTFKLTKDQINTLKAKYSKRGDRDINTTNDIVSGHIWRCHWLTCGDMEKGQTPTLHVIVDGRPRFQEPALPLAYVGNVVFFAVAVASGDLMANPCWNVASRVHEAVARMDNEYMRSIIDSLELNPHTFRLPNIVITSWRWFPLSDFGWGKPIFLGPGRLPFPGSVCILPCPVNDDSISFAICLQVEHMKVFETYLYDI